MSTKYKGVTVPEYEDHADGPKAFKDLVDGIVPASGGTFRGQVAFVGNEVRWNTQVFLTESKNAFGVGADKKGAIYLGDGVGTHATGGIEASWGGPGKTHPTLTIGLLRDGAKAYNQFSYDSVNRMFSPVVNQYVAPNHDFYPSIGAQRVLQIDALGNVGMSGRLQSTGLEVNGTSTLQTTNVAGLLTTQEVSTTGKGVAYPGSTAAGASGAFPIGFRYIGPNLVAAIDNNITCIVGVASDRRLKANFVDLSSKAMAMIGKMPAVFSYNPKDFEGVVDEDVISYGMIADEMEPIFPDLVEGGIENMENGEKNYQSINYLGIVPLLVDAVKELSAKVAALESA